MKKFCVGIDVDKQTFKVCLMQRDEEKKKVLGSRTFANSATGFDEVIFWSSKKLKGESAHYVMEATGVYHEPLAYTLHRTEKAVHIVLPLKAKRYMQSLGLRSKTDQIDAKGLAMMGLEQSLEQWQPASEQFIRLRALTRQIEALKEHITAFKNQLEGATHSEVMPTIVVKSINQMIDQADKQVAKLEKEVEKAIQSDACLKEKYELLGPLKGVGMMTFAVVVSETNGFTLFRNQRQLVSYAGYDIVKNDSGKRVGKTKISKKGNTHIRRILHMAALSAVKNKTSPFHQLYDRIYKRKNIKMKGYVAVQRKLLVMIYTLWKTNQVFDPDFGTSDNHEPKLLCSVSSEGTKNITASKKVEAALDRLPHNQSPEALCSIA